MVCEIDVYNIIRLGGLYNHNARWIVFGGTDPYFLCVMFENNRTYTQTQKEFASCRN